MFIKKRETIHKSIRKKETPKILSSQEAWFKNNKISYYFNVCPWKEGREEGR